MPDVPEPIPDAPTLNWCVGRTRTTATWTPVHDQSWSSFVQWLKPDQPASSKEVSPYVGGTLTNGRRTARTVEQRFFLTLDADYADPDFPLETEILLHDVPYIIHTTWRHRSDAHRYRLIVPLSRGVTPNEHKELAWLVMDRLGGDQFDKTTAQAERFMWGPSTQDPGTYFHRSAHAGAPYLPVDAWLDGQHSPAQTRTGHGGANTPPAPVTSRSEALSGSPASDEDIERAEEILAQAVDDVLHLRERGEFAGRNEAVFHLLPLLLRFAKAGALDEDLVLDSLFNATQLVPADEPYTRQEFEASVRSARAYAEQEGPTLPETTRTRLAQADFEDVDEPENDDEYEELWTASPQLRHIAQAADSVNRNRLAMLAAVLTRILVQVDAGICLAGVEDGSIGPRAALNLGVALVGRPGQGKTTILDTSRDLLPGTGMYEKDLTTGQGLIAAYMRWDKDEGVNKLREDPKALFICDEIDTLAANSSDTTSTLLSELRTMLMGGKTGTTTATQERNRQLQARSYNFQTIVNLQPHRAGVLLRERDAGTPQRFVWVTVTDPEHALDNTLLPPWPGPLDWSDAFTLHFELNDPVVDIPQWMKDELREQDAKISREGLEGDSTGWSAHKNLLRLKVAAGIAFLHECPTVTDEYIHLADLVLAGSDRVQRTCERLIRKSEFEAKVNKVKSDTRVLELVGDEKLDRLVSNALKGLKKRDGWVPWRDIRPAYRDRDQWDEPVWEHLSKTEGVEVVEESHGDGVRRKARWIR